MKNILLFLILLTSSQISIFAQTNSEPAEIGNAFITNNFCVTLNTSDELKKTYKINISALNFQSEVEAKKAFGKISNNYLTYVVDFEQQVVFLKVHSERIETAQTVDWWNEYLYKKCH